MRFRIQRRSDMCSLGVGLSRRSIQVLTEPSITVAGPLLTEKTSLILYVFRTCPARIRPGKRHELPIKKYNVTHNYFQIGWCNCNASTTVASPLLTEKTSLILYVFRTCPARIRP